MRKTIAPYLLVLVVLLLSYLIASHKYYSEISYAFHPYTQIDYNEYNSFEKDSNEIVVLCLGGSTTYSSGEDSSLNYPTTLQIMLSENFPNKKITVLNGGMDWYTSLHSLITYTSYYKHFNPDMVLIMHAINDVCRSFSPIDFALGPYQADYSHYYGPAYNATSPIRIDEYLIHKIQGNKDYSRLNEEMKEEDYSLNQYLSKDSYEKHMQSLVSYVKSNNSTCYFIEQPFAYDDNAPEQLRGGFWFGRILCNNFGKEYPNEESMKGAMLHYNFISDSIARFNSIAYIHTNSSLEPSLLNYLDEVHYTEHGAQQLASIIFDVISADSLFSK